MTSKEIMVQRIITGTQAQYPDGIPADVLADVRNQIAASPDTLKAEAMTEALKRMGY